MALSRRGDIWHYDFTFKGGRYRGSTERRSKTEAKEVADAERDRIRDALKLGKAPGRKVHTLGEVADKWFATKVTGRATETDTAQRLKILFRHVDRQLPVSDLTEVEINDAIMSRRVEPIRQSPKAGPPRLPTNSTVNRDLIDSTLRPMLKFAARSLGERVHQFEWAEIRLKEPKGRVRSFTAAELAAWGDELPEWHRPLWRFIQTYGVRLDEAFFPPSAVDADAGIITLYDTKNGTDHALPIKAADMVDLAQRARQATLAKLDTIWFRDRGGRLTPIKYRGFQSASATAIRRAGVTNAKPAHDLRHHAATSLLRTSGNLKLVGELLNHKSIVSTARYAHTDKADLRKALEGGGATKAPAESFTDENSPVESK